MSRTNVVVNTQLRARDTTSPSLRRIARTARTAARAVRGIARATGRVAISVGRTTSVVAGLGSALATISNFRTEEITRLAQSVGQTSEAMSAFGVIASQMGLSTENVIDLAEEMNNKLGEFSGLEDMTSAREALQMMGLEFENIRDLTPEEQFAAITNALVGMEDAQQASSAADMIFGGEGSRIFGLLHRLGLSYDDVIEQYREANFLTEEGRRGAGRWATSMRRLGVNATTLGQNLSGVLGGALSNVVDQFSTWLETNQELINSKINEWGQDLADWASQIDANGISEFANEVFLIAVQLGAAANSVMSFIEWISRLPGEIRRILEPLRPVGQLLGDALIYGFIGVVTAIGETIKFVERLGTDVANFVTDLVDNFTSAVSSTIDGIMASFGAVRDRITEISNFVSNHLEAWGRGIQSTIDGIMASIEAVRRVFASDPSAPSDARESREEEMRQAVASAQELLVSGEIARYADGSIRDLPGGQLVPVDILNAANQQYIPLLETGGDAGVAESLGPLVQDAVSGQVDVNVTVRGEGVTIQSVGTTNSSSLVGNVGTNRPGIGPQ